MIEISSGKSLAYELTAARRALYIPVQQIANSTGIDPSQFFRWARGTGIGIDRAVTVGRVLGLGLALADQDGTVASTVTDSKQLATVLTILRRDQFPVAAVFARRSGIAPSRLVQYAKGTNAIAPDAAVQYARTLGLRLVLVLGRAAR